MYTVTYYNADCPSSSNSHLFTSFESAKHYIEHCLFFNEDYERYISDPENNPDLKAHANDYLSTSVDLLNKFDAIFNSPDFRDLYYLQAEQDLYMLFKISDNEPIVGSNIREQIKKGKALFPMILPVLNKHRIIIELTI